MYYGYIYLDYLEQLTLIQLLTEEIEVLVVSGKITLKEMEVHLHVGS